MCAQSRKGDEIPSAMNAPAENTYYEEEKTPASFPDMLEWEKPSPKEEETKM